MNRPPPEPTPRHHLSFDVAPLFQEEEIIGGALYGESVFYQQTAAGPRARYRVRLDGPSEQMFLRPGSTSLYGWYTTKNPDCRTHSEAHDTDGDGNIEPVTEAHCVDNGEYTLELHRVAWNSAGTAFSVTDTLFRRRIAMLDSGGVLQHNPSSSFYHDARVLFDLVPATTSLAGDIRAGDVYRYIASEAELYPLETAITVAAGDTLWLVSTYLAQGSDGRPWYNQRTALFTAFNQDYAFTPAAFGPAVNSAPAGNAPPPMLHIFTAQELVTRTVIGRVIEPYHAGLPGSLGRDQTGQSISVTVVPPVSCFTYSGSLSPNQPISFDGRCSSVYGQREYRWSFGDGTPATAWSAADSMITHVYAAGGNYQVRLDVRRLTSVAPTDDTVRVLSLGSVLDATISGPDLISQTGTYQWSTTVSGGAPPYHYRWFYYRSPGPEQPVGTDSPDYSRFVAVNRSDAYVFRLTDSVSDASAQRLRAEYFVEVTGGGGALALDDSWQGVRFPDGSCRRRPPSGSARQEWLRVLFLAARRPEACRLAVS